MNTWTKNIVMAAIAALSIMISGCGNVANWEDFNAALDTWSSSQTYLVEGIGEDMAPTGDLAPFLVDLDHNGTLDMVMGDGDGYVHMILNSRADGFAVETWNTVGKPGGADAYFGSNAAPCVADIDGDGQWEMGVGNSEGKIWYVEFQDFDIVGMEYAMFIARTDDGAILTVPGGYAVPTLADINHDGLTDLLVGGGDGFVRYYQNTGKPNAPAFRYVATSKTDFGDNAAAAVIDIDGDPFLDYVIGNAAGEIWACQGQTERCVNMGQFDMNVKPATGDFTNDGWTDVVLGTGNGYMVAVPSNPTP